MELHEDVVRRALELDTPREKVWDALADAEGLERWLAASVDVDIREGAEGTVTDHDGTVRRAVVEEVTPGRRLALRWRADGEGETLVEVTLDDAGEGRTRLTVVEVPVYVVTRAVRTALADAGSAGRGPAMLAGVR